MWKTRLDHQRFQGPPAFLVFWHFRGGFLAPYRDRVFAPYREKRTALCIRARTLPAFAVFAADMTAIEIIARPP